MGKSLWNFNKLSLKNTLVTLYKWGCTVCTLLLFSSKTHLNGSFRKSTFTFENVSHVWVNVHIKLCFTSCSLAVRRPPACVVPPELHWNVLWDRSQQVTDLKRPDASHLIFKFLHLIDAHSVCVCVSEISPTWCTLTSSNVWRGQTSWLPLCRVSSVPPHRCVQQQKALKTQFLKLLTGHSGVLFYGFYGFILTPENKPMTAGI